MQTTTDKTVAERLAELAMFMDSDELLKVPPAELTERGGLASYLAHLAQELEENYVQVGNLPNEEMPTNAQGLALARFLRSFFRDPHHASAFVSRGGMGLPLSYLYIRMNDGYEGGIDREGRVST